MGLAFDVWPSVLAEFPCQLVVMEDRRPVSIRRRPQALRRAGRPPRWVSRSRVLSKQRRQPASVSAKPRRHSAPRDRTSPPSDEIRPPPKSAVTFLRLTAGKSNRRRVSSVMVGVALSLPGEKCDWNRISTRSQRVTPCPPSHRRGALNKAGWTASETRTIARMRSRVGSDGWQGSVFWGGLWSARAA